MDNEKKRPDVTFKVLGFSVTIVLVMVLIYMFFVVNVVSANDVLLGLFTIAVLDGLFYMGHVSVNKK